MFAPGIARALDTRISLHSSPGGWPGDYHLELVPAPGQLTVKRLFGDGGARASFVHAGNSWTFEFGPPPGTPFGVGVYDSAGASFEAKQLAYMQVWHNNGYTTSPYGSFEVRQVRRDASGQLTALWLTFQYRPGSPNALPFRGEIRWNADTSLYLRSPRAITIETGHALQFPVSVIDTRARPVTLTATDLPAGASFTPLPGGHGLFEWPTPPATEGRHPIRFQGMNDQALQDTTSAYVTVARPFRLTVGGDPSDVVTRGVPLTFQTDDVTIYSSWAGSDSAFALNVYKRYHSASLVFRPPIGFAFRPGTYQATQLDGRQTPTEAGVLAQIDGRNCSSIGSGILRLREYRIGPDGKTSSIWAELLQSCEGSPGRLWAELRWNCDTTLDVQAPAALTAGLEDTVTFEVTSRTSDGVPATLSAPMLPAGATFTDRGDGVGIFRWPNTTAAGSLSLATFVATSASGRRDTVTTRIRSAPPFRVTLAGVPGVYPWLPAPSLYDASNGTLTFTESADSSLTAAVAGQGHSWAFTFTAPGVRRLQAGLHEETAPDWVRQSSKPRLRVGRDNLWPCSRDASFHIRKLARAPNGSIRSFWATFRAACEPGAAAPPGEIRFQCDTTLYLNAPAEVMRVVGSGFQFVVRAVEAAGLPTHLSLLGGPAQSTLADHGDGTATFTWAAGASTPGLVPVTIRTVSDAGIADTTTIVLRATVPARFAASGAPGDPVTFGSSSSFDQESALFRVQKLANGTVTATVAGAQDLWSLSFRAPRNAVLTPGLYPGALQCVTCVHNTATPAMDVAWNDRKCNAAFTGAFDVRRIRYAPDGSVRSLWVRFDQTCPGALRGDLQFATDTSVYFRAASYVTTEEGRALSVSVSAVDTRGLPVHFGATTAPEGATIVDHGDGTATLEWPSGAPSPGLYPVTWIATSEDGKADTLWATIEAFRTALFVIRGGAGDPVAGGLDLRYTGSDGAVTTSMLSDSTQSVGFDRIGRRLLFRFQAPRLRTLRQGVFTNARRYTTNEIDQPGLQVEVDGVNCNMDTSMFHVRRLRRGPSGALTSLWVVFQQRCAGGTAVTTGELRVSADTSLYIDAPAEVTRFVGEPTAFAARAVDTRGIGVTLSPVELPAGATYTPADAAGGDVVCALTDTAGSVTRIVFAALSDDGVADTVVTLVHTFAPGFVRIQSAPGDYLGLGQTYNLSTSNGSLSVTRPDGRLRVHWAGKLNAWEIMMVIPYGRAPAVGSYDGAFGSNPVTHVGTSGRGCSTTGRIQIRKVELESDGRVKALWMTFTATCTASNPGIRGEVWFGADSSFFLEGPADLYIDPGPVVAYDVRAMGALAADASWTLVTGPPGGSLQATGAGTARFTWPGTTVPGNYAVVLFASGNAGADTLRTWLHVPSPTFMAIRSAPTSFWPSGIDRSLRDRDGTLSLVSLSGNRIRAQCTGPSVDYLLELGRSDGQRIVPGDYPVTGLPPPQGASPNSVKFVWGGLVPSLTTGAFHVHEVVYDQTGSVIALWATWEMNHAGYTTPISGEVHFYGPDSPTPVAAALVHAIWERGANRLLWYVPGAVGSELVVSRRDGDGPWTALDTLTVDGTSFVRYEDRAVTRGVGYGYRLSSPHDPNDATSEAWIDVPEAVNLAVARDGPNPGPDPSRYVVHMPEGGPAELDLIDVTGRVLDQRQWDDLPEGRNVVALERASSLEAGCYFVRLRARGRTITRTVIVLR